MGGDRGVERAPDRVRHVDAEIAADVHEDGAYRAAADLFGQFLDGGEAGEEVFLGSVRLGFGAFGLWARDGQAETGIVDLFGGADEALPQGLRHAPGAHDAGHDEGEILGAEGSGDGTEDVRRRVAAEGVGEAPAEVDKGVDDDQKAERG